jgi:Domain of unknown function (DUF4266)
MSMHRCRHVVAVLLLGCGGLGGCSLQPWVKPYEREQLSDPIMNLQRSALMGQHREHVLEVREGARGATGIQGSGCGCN